MFYCFDDIRLPQGGRGEGKEVHWVKLFSSGFIEGTQMRECQVSRSELTG